ncbi:hypothetical protein KRR26_15205 [Corallococcus sp. M34]|uniref:AarF/UbiB family protein n=1 Tax=Citreicoccus inhibens TaxID=2849499 RepID=UPI001C24BEC9|nr:AarF/UbiB family protein [Citreicoccus inhibens]MBU8896966.1 hypothetical protein [Citreicoccus inhibens]
MRRSIRELARRRSIRELVRVLRRAKQEPEEAESLGRRARQCLDSLGGFWWRARELIASRLDVFPTEFCRHLEGGGETGDARPIDDAQELVARVLGSMMERRLEAFEPRPVRVSFFGQVHTATLKRSGTPVWVVVRRPDAEPQLHGELAEMESFFARLSRTRELAYAPWERLMRELRASLRDGLDLRIQAHAMRELRKQVRSYRGARYPHVFQQLCRAEVLVAERVQAPTLAEVEARALDVGGPDAWYTENDTDPKLLAGRLWKAFMRQLVEARTLVPTQGPEDILLLGNNTFCYRFEPFVLPSELGVPRSEAFHFLLHALLRRSYEGAFFPLLRLAEPLPPLEPHQLKKVVSREIRAWAQRSEVKTLPGDLRSFGALFDTVLATMRRHPIVFDSAVLRACQELRRLEGALFSLHPRFGVAGQLRRFFKRSVRRAARRLLAAQAATPPAPDWDVIGQAPFTAREAAQDEAQQSTLSSLPFASEPTAGAYLVSHVAAFLSVVCLAFVAVFSVAAARVALIIHLSPDSWVERTLVNGLRPDLLELGLAVTCASICAWGLWRLAVRFAERDSHLPTRRVI